MGFGVFIHRTDSIYDDSPAERYQFPRQYLSRVGACVGYWIVYYEPRKVAETRGYFAIAKVERVVPDPTAPGMFLALIEPGSYLDFANPVPFSDKGGVIERGVLNQDGRISSRAQAAVRPLSPSDFDRIIARGLDDRAPLLPRTDADVHPNGFSEEQAPFVFEESRERVSYLSSRIVRDRVFRRIVLRAYDERCAISGLKLINGGGAGRGRGCAYSAGSGERSGYRQQWIGFVRYGALDVRPGADQSDGRSRRDDLPARQRSRWRARLHQSRRTRNRARGSPALSRTPPRPSAHAVRYEDAPLDADNP